MTHSTLTVWRYFSAARDTTILFEAGHFQGDYEGKKLENMFFVALVSSL
jgi:hypothetical protein